MKKSIILFFISSIFGIIFMSACNTSTTNAGFTMAKNNQTTLTYSAMGKNPDKVKDAIVYALTARKWIISNSDYPITAELNHRGQFAKLSITYTNNKIVFETKGSNINGKAYVPIRFVDFLMKTIYKHLN